MKIYYDECMRGFEFWSGAKDNAKKLTLDELDELDEILEDIYPNGVDKTELNDLFWFDFGYICSLLGYEYDEENDIIIR